jgi:Predicted periplasmic or secreted lipoprotein
MPMTSKQMVKLLKKNGFKEIRQNGSHLNLKNDKKISIVVPMHNKDLDKGLEHSILKKAGLK